MQNSFWQSLIANLRQLRGLPEGRNRHDGTGYHLLILFGSFSTQILALVEKGRARKTARGPFLRFLLRCKSNIFPRPAFLHITRPPLRRQHGVSLRFFHCFSRAYTF